MNRCRVGSLKTYFCGAFQFRHVRDGDEPFMCLQYGMEEAAKHPVPAGKFVRSRACTRACPELSSNRGVGRLYAPYRCERLCARHCVAQRGARQATRTAPRADLLLRNGRRVSGVRALPRPEGSEGYLIVSPKQPEDECNHDRHDDVEYANHDVLPGSQDGVNLTFRRFRRFITRILRLQVLWQFLVVVALWTAFDNTKPNAVHSEYSKARRDPSEYLEDASWCFPPSKQSAMAK
jgi:hypothetical protein